MLFVFNFLEMYGSFKTYVICIHFSWNVRRDGSLKA